MGYLRWIPILVLLVLAGCKGGGGLDDPAVDATGDWQIRMVDTTQTITGGIMEFAKTGSNTWEAPWDDAWTEFYVELTVSGSDFTLKWVSEWTEGDNTECRSSTIITGTITQNEMTGNGTEKSEILSGPNPGMETGTVQLTFTADRL